MGRHRAKLGSSFKNGARGDFATVVESEVKLGLALGVGRRAVPFVDEPPGWNGAKSSLLKYEERSVMVDAKRDLPRYGNVTSTIRTRSRLKGIGWAAN